MSQVRIWNVTDDVRTSVVPHTRMVMGKVVKPGRSVLVDAARLEGATKVAKEVKVGHLYIGDVLPAEYTNQKKPPRAIADARIVGANKDDNIVEVYCYRVLPNASEILDNQAGKPWTRSKCRCGF